MKEEASAGGSSSTDLRATLLGERRDSSSDRCARILSSFAPVRVTLRVNMQCVSAADSHVCLVAHEVDLRLQGGCCYTYDQTYIDTLGCVCRQEVEERDCKPLALTCGHSFCEDCLSE